MFRIRYFRQFFDSSLDRFDKNSNADSVYWRRINSDYMGWRGTVKKVYRKEGVFRASKMIYLVDLLETFLWLISYGNIVWLNYPFKVDFGNHRFAKHKNPFLN